MARNHHGRAVRIIHDVFFLYEDIKGRGTGTFDTLRPPQTPQCFPANHQLATVYLAGTLFLQLNPEGGVRLVLSSISMHNLHDVY